RRPPCRPELTGNAAIRSAATTRPPMASACSTAMCAVPTTRAAAAPNNKLFRRLRHSYLVRNPVCAMVSTQKTPHSGQIGTSPYTGHPISRWRLKALRDWGAAVRFVSAEPFLASLALLNLTSIHMVIVGGESGAGYRKMDMQWARELRDKCVAGGIA